MKQLGPKLTAIEGGMTSKQFVCSIIDEVNSYQSIGEHSFQTTKRGTWEKMARKAEAIIDGIERRLKSEKLPDDAIAKRKRAAAKHQAFLIQLYTNTVCETVLQKYEMGYKGLAFAFFNQSLNLLDGQGLPEKTEVFRKAYQIFYQDALMLYARRYALEKIGREYFDGRDILPPEDRQWFDGFITSAESMAERFNAWFEVAPYKTLKKKYWIDLPAIQEQARVVSESLFVGYIQRAKINVLANGGYMTKAMNLMHDELLREREGDEGGIPA